MILSALSVIFLKGFGVLWQ